MKNREKIFAIGFLSLAAIMLTGAVATQITTYTNGSILTASQLNSEFGNLYSTINSLDDANIASGANINPNKIDAAIAGDGIGRNGSTGALEVNDDNSTLEITGDTLQVKDGGITLAKMASDSVNSAKIVDASIATADIGANQVTRAKLESVGQQISSASGFYTTTSATFVDVTNLSVSITTTGRPVILTLVPSGTSHGYVSMAKASSTPQMTWAFSRAAANLFEALLQNTSGGATTVTASYPCSTFHYLDAVGAGTYTYKFAVKGDSIATTTVTVYDCKLVAYEL